MARANTKGRVAIVTPADSDCMDETNDAVRVNVVAGGAGGGTAQLAVRNPGDTAWNDVGPSAARARVPVEVATPAGDSAMDEVNDAVRVNVVAGGAGGGTAQLAVRNAADTAWVNVGFQAGNLDVPVVIEQALPAGANNIGDVDVLTLPSLPAGANNIGDVDVLTLPSLPAGGNNIGDVDVLTLPSLPAGANNIGDVDVLTQPARSRTVDAIATADQTDALMDGLTVLTPKFARINGALSGDNTLVAAVATKKIRVLTISFVALTAVTANFQTAVAGAYLAGPYALAANGGVVLPYCPLGHFETVAGDLLNLELSAAVAVGGHLVYVEV